MPEQKSLGLGARPKTLLVVQDEFDERNLALARDVIRNPESYPHLKEWAPLVIERMRAKGGSNGSL
jgi:hypothetical protein